MRPSITERQEQNLRLLYDPASCPDDLPGRGAAPGEVDRPPVGSCDDCGVNLYGDEHAEGLCDQCSWARSQG